MNKGILIKVGIILGFFGVIFILAFGCESLKSNEVTPELTDREATYLSVGDITITNQDLWEAMKLADGYRYLVQYAEELLLSTYLEDIDPIDIDKEVLNLTYGTDDPILIAEVQEDAELDAELIKQYEDNLRIAGYDPENDADVKSFLELSIAKAKYTKYFIENVDSEHDLYVKDEDIQKYYEAKTFGDVCILDVRFSSENEVKSIFELFNIVPNFDSYKWGKYNDSANVPYEDVGTDGFDDTNTTVLTDAQTFKEFIKIWNYMNPNETPIPENTTMEDYCVDYSDMATRNHEDITRKATSSSSAGLYATYIFDTLTIGEESSDIRYSYKDQTVGDFSMLSFKVSQEDVPLYASLTDNEKAELRDEYVEGRVTSTALSIAMQELWDANEFVIYDPILKLQYLHNYGVDFDNNGDEVLVAKLGDVELTADKVFDYFEKNAGVYLALELVQLEQMLNSTYYTEFYNDDHEYLTSDNENIMAHREEINQFKNYFAGNGFASAGFDSSKYSLEEFFTLYLKETSVANVIQNVSVVGKIQPHMLAERLSYESAEVYMNKVVDEYFNLNVKHLLVFVDHDGDFNPDSYNEIVDGLSAPDLAIYEQLIVDLEALILDKIADGKTLQNIVDEFRDGLVQDPTNEWAEFKAYGFYIMTENLSANSSLSNTNSTNYDEDFVLALKRIYDDYVVEVENSIEDVVEHYDDRVFQSDFGVHFILATEGSMFEQPSAIYDNADGDDSPESVGTTVAPNKDQIELYITIKFSELVGEQVDEGVSMDQGVYDACEAYYGGIFANSFPTSENSMPTTIAAIDYVLSNGGVFTDNNDDYTIWLNDLIEILYASNFPEEYIVE